MRDSNLSMSPFACLLWSFVATFRDTVTRIEVMTTVRLNAQGEMNLAGADA
jgi:hypothetical protein